jgi:hypothetical protein
MQAFPHFNDTPLIRTDFSDNGKWADLVTTCAEENSEGFRAYITTVDDRIFEGMSAHQIVVWAKDTNHAVIFIADELTMNHPDRPILCIDIDIPHDIFWVIPSKLWSAENNLSIANMGFEEFVEATDAEGIYRGF